MSDRLVLWSMLFLHNFAINSTSSAIRSVAFSHDGQFIASGLEDGAVDIVCVMY